MNFTLKVLGTASALPTTERYPSAQVLDVRGRLFMIDCGEGAQIQLRRAKVSFLNIEHICLSHIHGDHIFGIFGLLSTMGLLARKAPLNIYAPVSFGPILDFFKQQFGEGILYDINFTPLQMTQPQVVYESRRTELLAFPLNHRVETFGFIIREKVPPFNVHKPAIEKYSLTLSEIGALKRGEDVVRICPETGTQTVIPNEEAAYLPFQPRSYAYCSDTAPFPELVQWVQGVDLLYHEATFCDADERSAVATDHSTARQAAAIAQEAGVGKLAIGHYSIRYREEDQLLQEAREVFPETVLSDELMQFSL